MIRLLMTPRWLGFTATALVAILAFGLLSLWQWHRAEEKRLDFQQVVAGVEAPAVPIGEALGNPVEWQHVRVSGRYGDQQVLLRNRPQDGRQGFWVVSPLVSDGTDLPDGEVVWVARGWIPTRGAAATGDVEIPPVPAGHQVASGYLRAASAEPARPSDQYPQGQIAALNTDDLTGSTGRDSDAGLSGWYVLAEHSEDMPQELTALALPEADDARNLSYAGQWLIFAAMAIGGWFYFLYREAHDVEQADQDKDEHPKVTA